MRHALALRLSTLVIFLVVLAAPAVAQDTPKTLTIASYNVENMLDVFDDPYTRDEDTPVKSRAALSSIAKAVKSMRADVVGFTEIENTGVLEALVSEMLSDEGFRYVMVMPANSDRGINLGVISRYPILAMTSHRFQEFTLPNETRTWRFARDLLQVRVALTNDVLKAMDEDVQKLELFIVHFKSRHDGAGDPMSKRWRLAEQMHAQKILSEVAQREPKTWIAMIGDYNDTPDAEGIVKLTAAGNPAAQGETVQLFDAHINLPAARRITYLREPYRSTIDYILTNAALRTRLLDAGLVSDPAVLGGSDHAPIWAKFRVGD
jgi:endonuclease/exonuclease/phosphatase family metal-dependent hydrolase